MTSLGGPPSTRWLVRAEAPWLLSPLIPAGGRDYKSEEAVRLAFDRGVDFVTPSGLLARKHDLVGSGLDHVAVRYNNHAQVAVLPCCECARRGGRCP